MSTTKKEYLCFVRVIEGRELAATDASGTCDPFVRIRVGDLPPQQGACETAKRSPTWDQSFTFSGLMMTDVQLESWELKIECIDFNAFMRNKLIGAFSLGLATIHRNSNHEFYHVWIPLLTPDTGSEPQGHLLIDCYVVGNGDTAPSHPIGEDAGFDIEDDSDDEYGILLPPGQVKQAVDRKKNLQLIRDPMFARKGLQFCINICKAEIYSPFDTLLDMFVSCRTLGLVERTKNIEGNPKPVWNTKMSFPAYKPILNDRITIRLWHRRTGRDRLIATIPEVPGERDDFSINNLLSRGGILPTRWINLYGPDPESETVWNTIKKAVGAAKDTYYGTCPVGRLLMSMSVSPNQEPETGISTAAPYREPPEELHLLRVNIFEIRNAKDIGDQVTVHVLLGKKKGKARANREKLEGSGSNSIEYYPFGSGTTGTNISMEDRLPTDLNQVPDIFINLYSKGFFGGKSRVGYIRVPVNSIVPNEPRWIPFHSVDHHQATSKYSPGLLLVSFMFGLASAIKKVAPKGRPARKLRYFYWTIHSGIDMAPSLSEDDTSINLKMQCGDKLISLREDSERNHGQFVKGNKFPVWNWSNMEAVNLREDLRYEQNLLIEASSGRKILGHISIPMQSLSEVWKRPQVFHVASNQLEGVSEGRILASFHVSANKKPNPTEIKVKNKRCRVDLALIGVRSLTNVRKFKVKVDIPSMQRQPDEKDSEPDVPVSPMNILRRYTFSDLVLPDEPVYLPTIRVRIITEELIGKSEAFTILPLIEYCSWIDEAERRKAYEIYYKPIVESDSIEQAPVLPKEDQGEPRSEFDIESKRAAPEAVEEMHRAQQTLQEILDPQNERIANAVHFDNETKHVL